MQKALFSINKKGFSLVEILVAISVFLIFLTAILNVTVGFEKQTKNSVNKERAVLLADEAIEASRNIRDADFANLIDGTYGVATSSNEFLFSGSSDLVGIFTRALTISTINQYQKKVDATVIWADQVSSSNSVTLTTYLTDWRKITPQSGITVTKTIINHGGAKTVADFEPYLVGTTTVTLGVAVSLEPGTYTVTEAVSPNYLATFGGDCDSGGQIILAEGDAKICAITNEEKVVPTVVSPTATSIAATSAVLGADVTSLGIPASISARGICYGTTPSPINCVAEGGTTTGTYTQPITGLTPGTLYYYRGYAANSFGVGYSADGTFTTLNSTCSGIGLAVNADVSNSNSVIVSKPVGVQQGDIMFAHVMHENAIDALNSVPSGWIQIGRHRNGSSNQALFYKVAGAGEPADYTFGFSVKARVAVTINAYRGCFNAVTPIDTSSNVEYVVNNTTYRAASMNLSSAQETIIIFPSVNSNSVRTFTAPATQGGGWATSYDYGNGSSRFSRAAFSKVISSSGATGNIDATGFSASTVKHAFAVALKPL